MTSSITDATNLPSYTNPADHVRWLNDRHYVPGAEVTVYTINGAHDLTLPAVCTIDEDTFRNEAQDTQHPVLLVTFNGGNTRYEASSWDYQSPGEQLAALRANMRQKVELEDGLRRRLNVSEQGQQQIVTSWEADLTMIADAIRNVKEEQGWCDDGFVDAVTENMPRLGRADLFKNRLLRGMEREWDVRLSVEVKAEYRVEVEKEVTVRAATREEAEAKAKEMHDNGEVELDQYEVDEAVGNEYPESWDTEGVSVSSVREA